MEWKRGPVIGRGSTAAVHLATTVTGDHFAVKSTELSTSVYLQKEQQFLSQLNSPYVISYMGYNIDYNNNKPMFNLFMEYAPGGTISDLIKKNRGPLDESLIRSYTYQILMGLNHIQSNNLVHCDIKCENILVGNNCVKIGDLGCAKLVENRGGTSSEFSGTPVFMSPEVARGEEQGFAADVWALGCVVIEMATGCNAWPEVSDPVACLYKIGYSGELPEFPRWLSPEGRDFLINCLKRDAKERWTVKELLRHPFLDNSNTKNSPTSILDQDFWGSLNVPDTSPATTQHVEFSGESPVERIMQLIETATPSCLPNWIDEEDWIMVRSNHIEESVRNSEQIFSSILVDDTELTRDGSTRTESSLLLNIHVERMSGFEFFMLENDVEGGNNSVTIVFGSRFIDFQKIFSDNYLLLCLNLFVIHVIINRNMLFLPSIASLECQW